MLALIAVIIAAILLLPSCGSRGGKAEADTESTTLVKAGDKAPDFTVEMFDGTKTSLAELKGKVVLLNFWATWCPPCRREMPDIQKLYERYQAEEDPEVVILGVAAPDYGDEGSREEIAQFLEENGYTYPVVMDEGGELFMTYGVFSYPTTFMIDRDGNVFGYAAGQLSMEMMESIIRQTVTGVREQPGQ